MAENSETVEMQGKANNVESSKNSSQTTPLLPRSGWNSQLTYLKVILQAKQTLDSRRYSHQHKSKI